MSRTITLGNGKLFIALDQFGDVRELCWPVVGAPNHLAGRKIQLGIWVEHQFSWFSSEHWSRSQSQVAGSGKGVIRYRSEHFGLDVFVADHVHPSNHWWSRSITVHNLWNQQRQVRVFQSQQLRINETDIGDTALYHQESDSVVHFKSDTCFAFAGKTHDSGIHQFATGLSGVGGFDGTWRDAEDGELAGKPIEQGSVDSTFSVQSSIQAGDSCDFKFGMVCDHLIETATEQVSNLMAWQEDTSPSSTLPITLESAPWSDPVRELLIRSLEVVRAHTGDKGQVIAAIDSDIMESNRSNYGYVWMRDACLTGRTMAELGEPRAAAILSFLPESESNRFLWQKYHPSGARGSTWHSHAGRSVPYQLDETALAVWHMSHLLKSSPNDKASTRVRGWADVLANSIDADGLPPSGWDLWEEREGIHFWTVATILEALATAEDVWPEQTESWTAARGRLQSATEEHFLKSPDIPRRIFWDGETLTPDSVADSSVLAGMMFYRGFTTEHLKHAFDMVRSKLLVNEHVTGACRYEGDYYCRTREGYPGNPWIVCTMWLARAEIILGERDGMEWLEWVARHSLETGVLPEQINPDTGEPISVCPLVWSHAEVLETAKMIATKNV